MEAELNAELMRKAQKAAEEESEGNEKEKPNDPRNSLAGATVLSVARTSLGASLRVVANSEEQRRSLFELKEQIEKKMHEKEKLKESGASEAETGKESGAGGTALEPVGANNSKVIEDPYRSEGDVRKPVAVEDPYNLRQRESISDPYSTGGGTEATPRSRASSWGGEEHPRKRHRSPSDPYSNAGGLESKKW